MEPPPRLDTLPDLVTVDEAATVLRCSPATVRRLIHAGKLKRLKVGRLDRLPRIALEEFIANREV